MKKEKILNLYYNTATYFGTHDKAAGVSVDVYQDPGLDAGQVDMMDGSSRQVGLQPDDTASSQERIGAGSSIEASNKAGGALFKREDVRSRTRHSHPPEGGSQGHPGHLVRLSHGDGKLTAIHLRLVSRPC
jgi:hypothetical protein